MKINLTDRQWLAAMIITIMLIGAIVLVGVGLSQSTPQEQLISDLSDENVPVEHEKELLDLIDSICPTIDTSYIGLDALKTYMSEQQAFDTLRIVRYTNYCDSI